MVNEGAKILEEGIAQRASDIDVVWVYGYGWPVYRGGPMFWADTEGLAKIVEGLKRQEERMRPDFSFSQAAARQGGEGREVHPVRPLALRSLLAIVAPRCMRRMGAIDCRWRRGRRTSRGMFAVRRRSLAAHGRKAVVLLDRILRGAIGGGNVLGLADLQCRLRTVARIDVQSDGSQERRRASTSGKHSASRPCATSDLSAIHWSRRLHGR